MSSKISATRRLGDRVAHVEAVRGDLDLVPGTARIPRRPAAASRSMNDVWSGKIDSSSPSITLRCHRSSSRKAGGPALGTTARGVDRLDVPHGAGELALDLGVAERTLAVVGQVVDHRVPDRTRVLQPVQVDRAVRAQCAEVGGPAVVLVDQPAATVADHHRRVAARAVGDRHLRVDRDREAWRKLELLAVDRADELGETQPGERALLLVSRIPRQQDRNVAAQVGPQPRFVVMVARGGA